MIIIPGPDEGGQGDLTRSWGAGKVTLPGVRGLLG